MSPHFPFHPRAEGFSLTNARSLSMVAAAVYSDYGTGGADDLASVITGWGFDCDRCRWFDRAGTQALLLTDAEKSILAFRGTEPDRLEDWVTDADVRKRPGPGGTEIHGGFAQGLHFIWPDIIKALKDFHRDGQSLWITGHSLGGALATLAAAQFILADVPSAVDGVYTFGQPRAGSNAFAAAFNARMKQRFFRFVNNNDVVTRVPPQMLGFSHVGLLKYLDADGRLHADTELTWWGKFWDRLEGRLECYLQDRLFDGFDDHNMRRYRDCLAAIENLED